MKISFAVALLLGNVSAIDMNDNTEMIKLKLNIANPEEAAKAHRKYNHALVDFYDALPQREGMTYREEMRAKAEDLKDCYAAWHAKSKVEMQYVDVDSFNEYYDEEKAASVKRNETIKAQEEAKKKAEEEAKKKAEEDAKKKEEEDAKKENEEKETPAEEELSLEGEEPKEPKEKEEKEDPKKDYFFAELDNLKNAGVAFDDHVQHATANLAKKELKMAGVYYPEALKMMEADGNFDGIEQYKSIVEEYKVPVADFEAATKAVQDLKAEAKKMLTEVDGLNDFFNDPDFKTVYIRTFAKFEGVPSHDQILAKLEEHKDDKFTPYLKKALKYSEDLKESDRLKFNELLKNVLVKAREWAAKGKKLDEELFKIGDTLKKHHSAQNVQDASGYVTEAATQRAEMVKVWKALNTLNSQEEKAIKVAEKYQKKVELEDNASTGIIVIIVLLVLLTVGGITYCKCAKKCCFADKEEEGAAAEGGAADKTLFKKEVKGKKKNAKESLMPAFKVADEQA